MNILIPPSEGKVAGGTEKALGTLPADVIKRLEKIPDNPESFYGLKEKALEKAILANNNLTTSKTLPAIKRYTGVVFQGIDYDSLSTKGKAFFDKHVIILSGLFGPITPQTLIPNYKYTMQKGESFVFEEYCIDLLPKLHHAAVSYDSGIRIDFIVEKDGKQKPAGHKGKYIKGRFIRFLCEKQITDLKDFSKFNEEGFIFDGTNFVKKA
ncbi:MAG: peroxide stress protein YaaA [Candidatus Woesearchaeota archaeon]